MSFIPVKLCLRLHLLKGINWRPLFVLKVRDVCTLRSSPFSPKMNRRVNNKALVGPSFSEFLLSISICFGFLNICMVSINIWDLITFPLLTFQKVTCIHPSRSKLNLHPVLVKDFYFINITHVLQHSNIITIFSFLSPRHNSIKTVTQRRNYCLQEEPEEMS